MSSNILLNSSDVKYIVFGVFVSLFIFFLQKYFDRQFEIRKIKEKQYTDFLSLLGKLKSDYDDSDLKKELSANIQIIYLVGNKDVQENLTNFLNLFTSKSPSYAFDQNILYGKLIKSMKKDLYGKWRKSNCTSLDKIRFVIFDSNNNEKSD